MKLKKIIGIIIIIVLLGTTLTSIGMNNNTINENIKINLNSNQNKNENFDYGFINRNGIFNPPVMTIDSRHLVEDSISYEPLFVELPEYFSWKDYEGQDWTTPAKNQFNCGSCWAFAAIAALESIINIREGISDLDSHLSVQYILSCLTRGGCNGGTSYTAFERIHRNDSSGNNCNGIIPESFFPYQSDDTVPCDAKIENWDEFLIPISDYGFFRNDSIEAIKSQIIQVGPICSGMNADNENFTIWGYTNHNEDDYFPYEWGKVTDHVVIILGWKDDSSIEKGGYWICKNSWGSAFGYDGFFNIEYGSLRIGTQMTWVDYNPEDYDWHPTPKINGPYYGLINEPVGFNGETGGEHPPFTWLWDFGDDTTSTEQNPSHTYSNPGEYSVQLTVTDNNGLSRSDETFVWIQENNQPPLAPTINGTTEVVKGEYCWYNFSFSDPDNNPLYLYAVAFGFESNIWWGPYPSYWGKEFIRYYWDEEGDYIVKAKVKDIYGAESDWTTLEVTVKKDKKLDGSNPFLYQLFEKFPFLKTLL